MKIRPIRNQDQVPPADPYLDRAPHREPKLADYEEMVVDSAVLNFLLNEHPEGIETATLIAEMAQSASGEPGAAAVRQALARLAETQMVRLEGTRVLPGQLFGSAATGSGPGRN